MVRPVRLQLSRAPGFRLQEHSLNVNGLPAVSVARPGRWGNRYVLLNEEGRPLIEDRTDCTRDPHVEIAELLGAKSVDLTWEEAERGVVELFRKRVAENPPDVRPLRGRNLGCWCSLEARWCHADVWLDLANPQEPPR